jgi:GntR family transcriptional regulator/MocR family aminotransferase
MKLLYRKRREAVLDVLQAAGSVRAAGLAIHVPLARETDDVWLVGRLREEGFAPTALSQWYASQAPEKGLVIGITNAAAETMPSDAARLLSLIRNDFGPAPQSRGA